MPKPDLETIIDDKTQRFTDELGTWIRERMPMHLSDPDFAAASSALMIALNRQLAGCAAAFGQTHGVPENQLTTLVLTQFNNNLKRAQATLLGTGQMVQ